MSEDSATTGPVGQGNYTVQQGDCVCSIAFRTGHDWQTIWNHPNNAELKARRKDPNVLLPGDQLFVPPLEQKLVPCATNAVHSFVRKSVPGKLRLQFMQEGIPRANADYILVVNGKTTTGTLDGDGRLECAIPPNAQSGRVMVKDETEWIPYPLNLGHMDPITEISGIQARLDNMGLLSAQEDGCGEATQDALRQFQLSQGLPVTGQPDQATRDALVVAHGS